MPANVHQNASRDIAGSRRATAMAVVSSMVPCAAANRRRPPTCSSGASRIAYRVLRAPSSSPLVSAVPSVPPPATTPTTANCVPPVNASSDSSEVCSTDRPDATEAAPNATPYAPTATPTPSESRTTPRRFSSNTPPTLGRALPDFLNDPALAREAGRRHADVAAEVPGQVGLVGEAHLLGGRGDVAAGAQQHPGPIDARLGQVRVRGQPDVPAERPGQRERAAAGQLGQL